MYVSSSMQIQAGTGKSQNQKQSSFFHLPLLTITIKGRFTLMTAGYFSGVDTPPVYSERVSWL